MIAHSSRREFLAMAGAAAILAATAGQSAAQASGRIVVVGAGFGGAACARQLRNIAPGLAVTLVEQNQAFVTCPFSNGVIAGLDDMASITHGFDGLKAQGIDVVQARVEAIDADRRQLRLAGGGTLDYDRLVLSPGIDFKWHAIEGYDEAAAEIMPHAWKAGPQTMLLRRQLEAMKDGGTFVMAIPANPFRCPPGPYERASLIAHYLKTTKPRSKIILLDAKDAFSKQTLFLEGWKELYGDLIEWVPFGQTGALTRIDPATRTLFTDFGEHRADVANVIPPQRAATIVDSAGLAAGEDWCTVNPATFESTVVPGIHLLGDAIVAGDMPKSGFSATSQGLFCATAIAALQSGGTPPEPSFINTCYSLVGPEYGISVADVLRIGDDGTIKAIKGAGGISPKGASADFRKKEADYARGWYASITEGLYG